LHDCVGPRECRHGRTLTPWASSSTEAPSVRVKRLRGEHRNVPENMEGRVIACHDECRRTSSLTVNPFEHDRLEALRGQPVPRLRDQRADSSLEAYGRVRRTAAEKFEIDFTLLRSISVRRSPGATFRRR
jgi:hypothetical protein